MKKHAAFLYKCRNCGKIEKNPHTNEQIANGVLISIILTGKDSVEHLGTPVNLLSMHCCDKDNIGISDLIGYEVTDL